MRVIEKVGEDYNNQMNLYKQRKTSTIPKLEVLRWLLAAHKARVLSSFPDLDIGPDFESLSFTLEETTQRY